VCAHVRQCEFEYVYVYFSSVYVCGVFTHMCAFCLCMYAVVHVCVFVFECVSNWLCVCICVCVSVLVCMCAYVCVRERV